MGDSLDHDTLEQLCILIKLVKQLETDDNLTDNAHFILSDKNILVERIQNKCQRLLLYVEDSDCLSARTKHLFDAGIRVCAQSEDLFCWQRGVLFTTKGRVEF